VEFKNSETRYGLVSQFFHWSIALLFLFQFTAIVTFRFLEENPPDLAWEILNWHKSVGLLILLLGLLRLGWRLSTTLPAWPAEFGDWDKKVSHFAERGLYFALFAMVGSGLLIELAGGFYVPFFGLFHMDNVAPYIHPGSVSDTASILAARKAASMPLVSDFFVATHVVFAYCVVGFFSVHVAHVLRHHFESDNGMLRRMLPIRQKSQEE